MSEPSGISETPLRERRLGNHPESGNLAEVLQVYSRYAHVLPALRRIACKLGERRSAPSVANQSTNLRFNLGQDAIDRLCREYVAGASSTALARRYQLAPSSVLGVLRSNGVERRPQKRGSAADRRRALKLRSEGGTIKGIARQLGFSPATIKKWVDAAQPEQS